MISSQMEQANDTPLAILNEIKRNSFSQKVRLKQDIL